MAKLLSRLPYWLLLSSRNWTTKPGRAAASVLAIALGVGTVVWVTCSYESVRQSISEQVGTNWLGRSHLSVESVTGHWGSVDHVIAEPIARLPGVKAVSARLKRRMSLLLPPELHGRSLPEDVQMTTGVDDAIDVDVIGIDPTGEYDFRTYQLAEGKLLAPGDRQQVVLEERTARELGFKLGDRVTLRAYNGGPTGEFEVTGTFVTRRVAKFQQPMVLAPMADVQAIKNEPGKVTIIDVMVADPTPESVDALAKPVMGVVRQHGQPYQVTSGATKIKQLQSAQRMTEFILMLVASVALLTAFFIILTTMSMGMVERIGQLGTLRCLGLTRRQIISTTMMEVIPLGAIGLALGVPIGIGLTWLSTIVARQYLQTVAISPWGLWMALVSGAITTLAGALAPALQAARVSPLAATKPEAKPARDLYVYLAAAIGLVALAVHAAMVEWLNIEYWFYRWVTLTAVALKYIGYGLMTPLLIRFGATWIVRIVAALLGIRRQLLHDQIGKAAWRSGGICCGLMVGLSLIVSVSVHSESMIAGWDFPKKLAEGFVWSMHGVPTRLFEQARSLPGIKRSTLVNEIYGEVTTGKTSFLSWLRPRSAFVAGDAETFLRMADIEFIEGEREDALAKLKRGGYVLLPPESSRTFDLHTGDKLRFTVGNYSENFEVAGVVKSPALDIAVGYFQADSYMMLAASGSVLGTLDDARRVFGVDEATLMLLNFDIAATPVPARFEVAEKPPLDWTSMAQSVIAWSDADLIPDEREPLSAVVPAARAWLRSRGTQDSGLRTQDSDVGTQDSGLRTQDSGVGTQDSGLRTPDSPPPEGLRRYRDALAAVAEEWADMTPQERWDMFREQLVLRKIAAAVDRPRAIMGSIVRLKQAIDRDIREATLLFTAIPVVALIVASLGVGNLMMANVSSRFRQIAVLRAVGTTKWQIARMVLGEAIVLGAIGSLIGLVLGMQTAYNINLLTYRSIGFKPVWSIPWPFVLTGIGFAVGVCILAGITPARHAARNNIVDALQTA